MDEDLLELSIDIGARLRRAGLRLTAAESCTGGWIAKVLTDAAGSSAWFERGFVTYSNEAKVELLGVPPPLLERYGAVSEEVARAMAVGALNNSRAGISLAVTGIAGPSGGTADKPVGTVWFAWAQSGGVCLTRGALFQGEREAVRRAAVMMALQGVPDVIAR